VTSRASKPRSNSASPRILLGWREWLVLPELGIGSIRAKVDTGARSSSLHVREQVLFEKDGRQYVRFLIEHGVDDAPPRDARLHPHHAAVADRTAVADRAQPQRAPQPGLPDAAGPQCAAPALHRRARAFLATWGALKGTDEPTYGGDRMQAKQR
jgi:hypothetical protein